MACHVGYAQYRCFEYRVLSTQTTIDSDADKSPALAVESFLFVNLLQQEQKFYE